MVEDRPDHVSRRADSSSAIPKSMILVWPSAVTSMFSGFKSRCTTPSLCMYTSVSASWRARPSAFSAGSRARFAHHRAQRFALDVLHRDVHAAFLSRREDLDDAGMVEAASDFFLALKAAVENHVALELHVGNFDRDGLAVDLIDGFEDRRHPAARDHLGQLVLIEVFTDADLAHCSDRLGEKRSADVNIRRARNGSERARPERLTARTIRAGARAIRRCAPYAPCARSF